MNQETCADILKQLEMETDRLFAELPFITERLPNNGGTYFRTLTKSNPKVYPHEAEPTIENSGLNERTFELEQIRRRGGLFDISLPPAALAGVLNHQIFAIRGDVRRILIADFRRALIDNAPKPYYARGIGSLVRKTEGYRYSIGSICLPNIGKQYRDEIPLRLKRKRNIWENAIEPKPTGTPECEFCRRWKNARYEVLIVWDDEPVRFLYPGEKRVEFVLKQEPDEDLNPLDDMAQFSWMIRRAWKPLYPEGIQVLIFRRDITFRQHIENTIDEIKDVFVWVKGKLKGKS